jgi:hypothetical protein
MVAMAGIMQNKNEVSTSLAAILYGIKDTGIRLVVAPIE